VLAVALDLHVDVEVTPAPRLTVTSSGEGSDLPTDARHLAARVAVEVAGTDRLAISVHSDIPVGRGLGSSAALAVAAAAAAGADDPLRWGVAVDGHPENAAASATGGLVAATTVDGATVVRRLALDPDLRFVLLVPHRRLETADARAVLVATVPHADAAFNLGRMGLLIAGLADHGQLIAASAEDRLHQGPRTSFFPEAPALMTGLIRAGALAASWSGAGPSLVAFVASKQAAAVAAAAAVLLETHGVPGRVYALAADSRGVVTAAG
jgi:homoserine kinase